MIVVVEQGYIFFAIECHCVDMCAGRIRRWILAHFFRLTPDPVNTQCLDETRVGNDLPHYPPLNVAFTHHQY